MMSKILSKAKATVKGFVDWIIGIYNNVTGDGLENIPQTIKYMVKGEGFQVIGIIDVLTIFGLIFLILSTTVSQTLKVMDRVVLFSIVSMTFTGIIWFFKSNKEPDEFVVVETG